MIKVNLSGADLINARNAISFEEMASKGGIYEITGFGLKSDEVEGDNGNEIKNIAILKDSNGKIYSGVSAVVANFVEDIDDAVADGDITLPFKVSAEMRTCKGNAQRKFVSLMLHE